MTNLNDAFDVWKKDSTTPNMTSLLGAANPVLDKAVTSYAGRTSPVLKSRAKVLALKAFRSFDPKRGAKLRTHLMIQLQPLRREAVRSGQILQTPERSVYDRTAIERARQEFSSTFQRDATDTEIADRVGLSVPRIRQIQSAPTVMTPGQMGESVAPPAIQEKASDIWLEYVYYELEPSDKHILDWRLGRHGQPKLSNNAIAKKLGMSPAAISQRTAKIIARLQEGEGLDL